MTTYIAIEEQEQVIKRYFLEIIDETTPRFVVRNRIQQYLDYSSEEAWKENTNHPFPYVLLVCPDNSSEKYISKHIKRCLEEDISDIQFFVTTKNSILLKGVQQEQWGKIA